MNCSSDSNFPASNSNAVFATPLCARTPLWDDAVSWFTPAPDLTPCLLKLLLGAVPLAALMFFAPLSFATPRVKKRRWTQLLAPGNSSKLFAGKLLIGVVLLMLIAADLILVIVIDRTEAESIRQSVSPFDSSSPLCPTSPFSLLAPVEFLTPLLLLLAILFSLILTLEERRRFVKNSEANFVFFAALTIVAALMLQHLIRSAGGGGGGGGQGGVLIRELYQKDQLIEPEKGKLIIFYAIFGLGVISFILSCFSDRENQPSNCEDLMQEASILSKLLFWFIVPLIMKARKAAIQVGDVGKLPSFCKINVLKSLFDKHHNLAKQAIKIDCHEQIEEQCPKPSRSFHWILLKCFWPRLLLMFIIRSLPSIQVILQPIIFRLMLVHVAKKPNNDLSEVKANDSLPGDHSAIKFQMSYEEWIWKGIFFSSLILITELMKSFSYSHFILIAETTGLAIKNTIIQAIYHKSLRLNSSFNKTTSGKILNLMSVDAMKYLLFTKFLFILIYGPLEIIFCCYLIWRQIGLATLGAISCLILIIPLNFFFGKLQVKYQKKNLILKDERVKYINEIFHGIKIIKLYAWEESFQKKISQLRATETKFLLYAHMATASVNFMFNTVPMIMAILSFSLYVVISENNLLSAEVAFVTLSLINIMRKPLYLMPRLIKMFLQLLISGERIENFLIEQEVSQERSFPTEPQIAIQLAKADCSWNLTAPTLKSLDFRIPHGALVCIVGSVGSGKSSLLASILGEMKKQEGEIQVDHRSIAYVAQQPWIFNASLRDNVLFGKGYIEDQYDLVVFSCALSTDLQILAAGDSTEIGENGVNISGGQKARVALARAAYADKQLYLLDDPLSAVDAHVAKHIFQNLLGPNGLLKKRTRVLVTHNINCLQAADLILCLKDGSLMEVGKFDELMKNPESLLFTLTKWRENCDDHEMQMKNPKPADQNEKIAINGSGKLLEKEAVQYGVTDLSVFLFWVKNASRTFFFLGPFIFGVGVAAEVSSSFWLADWTKNPNQNNFQHFILIYSILGISSGLLIMIGTFFIFAGSVQSSKTIHKLMIERVIRAPMHFFDTVPVGRITNRFSKDMDIADDQLPQTTRDIINRILLIVSIMVTICIISPYMLVVFFITLIILFTLQRLFLRTSRQLKRLEAVTKSPVYSKFDETLKGMVTIRAFEAQRQLANDCHQLIDANASIWLSDLTCNSWILLGIQCIAAFMQYFTAVLTLLNSSLTPGLLGISLSYSFLMNGHIQWLMIELALFESHFVAIERIAEFSRLDVEPSKTVADDDDETLSDKDTLPDNSNPPATWPHRGDIVFNDLSVRYRSGLDLVLKKLTLSISGGQRVGVVGRTGAGKSTLALALFRVVEAETPGDVVVDGRVIGGVDLRRLRSSISVIPQDPVVFSGSLRFNVDPFEEKSDDEVRRVLQLAHLQPFVDSRPEGIEFRCTEFGTNLSVGQKQLLCLARALLRRAKILVLDEATAAVDQETDDLIQETIRKEFAGCTIITIAHRINTILDYDKILVLDDGKIVEFDETRKLLNDVKSAFSSLVKEANSTN